jgi:hypothetical protein
VQLTVDGGEEQVSTAAPSRHASFSHAQREILRLLAERTHVTSTEAGRIVHLHREPACRHCREGRCPWAASDGGDALKRLQARGLVRRVARGLWTARS